MENIFQGIEFKIKYFNGELKLITTKCLFTNISGKDTYNLTLKGDKVAVRFKDGTFSLLSELSEEERNKIINYYGVH